MSMITRQHVDIESVINVFPRVPSELEAHICEKHIMVLQKLL